VTINLEAGVYYFCVSEYPDVVAYDENEAAALAGTFFLFQFSGVLTNPTTQALGLVAPALGRVIFFNPLNYAVTITRLAGDATSTPFANVCTHNCKPNCKPIDELAYYVSLPYARTYISPHTSSDAETVTSPYA
jgi:hypothetical protein